MKTKRILSALMALLLMATLPITAFAEEYNIDEGSITVSADSTGQYVTQVGGVQNYQQTTETVITQTDSSTATDNTITVTTTGDAVAEFTVKDVNMSNEETKSAIDIGDSNAVINVEGTNIIDYEIISGTSAAPVHVSSGDLTLTSDSEGTLQVEKDGSDSALIGSHYEEEFSGTIHITGNINLEAGKETSKNDGYAAAIGSGEYGEMSGSIIIDEDAQVTAISDFDGAGIGAGEEGEMSGSIIIGGNAQVTAKSGRYGSGIGGCDYEGDFTGTVVIKDNAQVTAESSEDGSGIGAGESSDFTGTVVIKDNAQLSPVHCLL